MRPPRCDQSGRGASGRAFAYTLATLQSVFMEILSINAFAGDPGWLWRPVGMVWESNAGSSLGEMASVLILAIVQGVAEFLPISSSGHLVVLNELLGIGEGSVELNIVLHVGTLVAIVAFYWRQILALLSSDRRVIGLLVVGTIPAAVIGVIVKTQFEDVLSTVWLTGFTFPITGAMLLLLPRMPETKVDYPELGYGRALLIGLAQAFALLPGISRSGSTIVAGIAVGLKRQAAATFSFLLAIPAILGAGAIEAIHMIRAGQTTTAPGVLLLGAGVAFGVGLFSLACLVRWLNRGHLYRFAWWVIPLGGAVLVWQALG